MKFTGAFVLAVAGLAAASASSSSATAAAASASVSPVSSGCGTQINAIITACLQSTEPQEKACGANDWHCLCTAQKNIVTCYNNCPGDPDATAAKQTETSYCNAAKENPVSSSSSLISHKTTTHASASVTGNAAHTGFANSGGSDSSSSNAGVTNYSPVGGVIAAIFGLALL